MNFAYQYAVGWALSAIQYPSGRWVTYTINGANRASAVRNGQSGTSYYMQNVQYKPSGVFLSATVGLDTANQWTETREYNSLLQARKLRLVKGAQKVLGLDWIYSANSQYNASQDMYEETGTDNNGNLRMEKLAHTVGTPFSVDRWFSYDTANRLGSFSEPSKSQSFGYDAFGNLFQTGASGVPALRPNGSSWYLLGSGQVSNRLVNTAYDAAGHQTQLSLTPGTTASYDAEGRVSRVELNSSTVATYEYDADGRRVKKTVGATTTHYVYSADGQLMAEYGGTPASVGTQYLVADHLGSTRLILDAQGNCAERIDYAPFGAQLTRSGQPCYTSSTSGLPLFTGQIRDGESTAGTDTGLDYFNARYFWATLGRFTSPDAPFADQYQPDPQSWNLYSYTRNNPLRFIDNDGHIRRDANGQIVFRPKGKPTETSHEAYARRTASGDILGYSKMFKVQPGAIFADDGRAIEAHLNLDPSPEMKCDCHGLSFADGKYWINDDQIPGLMKGDSYAETTTPQIGDIGLYYEGKKVVHSVTVTGVQDGKVAEVSGLGGVQSRSQSSPPEAGWTPSKQKSKVTIRYYRKSSDDRTEEQRKKDANRIKEYEK
jgi:RHS repeat-associated protein